MILLGGLSFQDIPDISLRGSEFSRYPGYNIKGVKFFEGQRSEVFSKIFFYTIFEQT